MIRTLTLILSFFAAFTASGLSLGLFQVGVWANMFDQFYEETNSVLVSAERVFDGQHRCEGCEFVTDQGTSPKEALSSVGQSSEKIPLDKGTSTPVFSSSIHWSRISLRLHRNLPCPYSKKRRRRRLGFLSSSPFYTLTKRTFQLQEDRFLY